MTPRALGLIAAAVAFAIDQSSKYWIIEVFRLPERPPIRLLPVLDLVMAWNRGISYSLFSADTPTGQWILLAVTLAAIALLGAWLWRAKTRLTTFGLGLIVGGALGNAYDRFVHGAVADFLHFHTPFSLGPLSNYVFNLADTTIVAGVAVLLYESIFARDAQIAPRGPSDRPEIAAKRQQ